ncbi:decarboxylating precorrin-6Y C5,15-methyltransferase [Thermosipho africanus H17ap60334]|uniref:precorrin-6Y C5,15-methyltransferase (decarboxylating) subunit CbiT n=1 Tax=Thermosipho africanus TaxID=2421 RepID=UPI00028CC90A|nr:precorrin-6Y C5,15-methyltransferase (decarboxylating) subunit CbiT [Thermosipho africanus]EKF50016.1 decarboxylating precorrin-6Y C5,15-methyltransferase [Thermosipho africanus H17ap60334]
MYFEDEFFLHENTPITKSEIRAIVYSKLNLNKKDILWDIGAGSGAVSIEASFLCKKVFAVEKELERVKTIKENIKRANVKNIDVILGEAPQSLEALPSPTKVFIGGSEDKTLELLTTVERKILNGGIIVATSITLETLYMIDNFYKEQKKEIIQVGVTKLSSHKKRMFIARNPIFIITVWR